MLARLGESLSGWFRRVTPDPFVLAVLLTVLTAVLSVAFGFGGEPRPGTGARGLALLDAWRADDGLWRFLAFGMQMCLVLVTGHALAGSRPVARLIRGVARRPGSTASAAALVGAVSCLTALLNWGLGLIVGALLARETGRELGRRGIVAHYPLLAAAGYAGLLVWHGGLSGSAPLSVTTIEGAAKVLPAEALARLGGGIPLTATLLSPLNLFVTLGLAIALPLVLARLAPAPGAAAEPVEAFLGESEEPPVGAAGAAASETAAGGTLARRLERSPLVVWLLVLPLVVALVRHGQSAGLERVGLNEINAAMLALGLACHGSLRSYGAAAAAGARGCAGIILQFPLYAGILAMLVESRLVESFAAFLAGLGGETGVPLVTWMSAAVVNFFVPSGGGQWGIQGPIALEAGLAAGVAPGKMVLAVAYGDQLTNMLQPFWALPLLAITGVRARHIVGYTAVLMLAAAVWMAIGLTVF